MISKMLKLNDVFPNGVLGNGIFSKMDNPIWATTLSSSNLDIILFTDAGEKWISPLLRRFVTDANPVISESDSIYLASLLQDLFLEQWKRKYALLTKEYNPINNYDMTETEQGNGDKDVKVVGNDNHTITINDSVKDSGTVKATTDNQIYGFNSTTGKDSDSATGTNTTDMTNTRTSNNTDAIVKNDSETTNYHDTRTLTRSGNIGVTTTQQMIKSEIELWEWNFYKDVIVDVTHMLTLDTY